MFLKKSNRWTTKIALLSIFTIVPVFVFSQTTRQISVDTLFKLGIEHSLQIQSSQLNANMANSNLSDKKSNRFPALAIGVVGGYIGDPIIFQKGLSEPLYPTMPDWSQNYNISLTQPIYQGGKIQYAVEKADLERQIAQLNVEKDISEIKLLLIGKYLDLLRYYKQEEAIEVSISQARRQLRDIKNMEKNGMLTSSDVLRSQLRLSNYELTLTETKNNIRIISTQLDIALGIDETFLLIPETSLLENAMSMLSYDNYVDMAYSNYPELKISKSYVKLAQKESQIIKANYLPNLNLSVGNVLSRPLTSVSPIQDLYANNWNVALSLSYNLSSLYHNKFKMDIAKQSIEMQNIEQEKMMQSIRNDVKTYYIKHQEALERIKTLTISVEQANENYRIVLNKYRNQIAILTDLLDAGSLQLEAQLQLTNAKTTAIYTYHQLLRSSGNL